MRDLTQQEINEAPKWVTHYYIRLPDVPHFERVGANHGMTGKLCTIDGIQYHPIPRKELIIDAAFRKKVRKIALANDFKYKQQTDGSMDLNPYVFEFAKALLTASDLS